MRSWTHGAEGDGARNGACQSLIALGSMHAVAECAPSVGRVVYPPQKSPAGSIQRLMLESVSTHLDVPTKGIP